MRPHANTRRQCNENQSDSQPMRFSLPSWIIRIHTYRFCTHNSCSRCTRSNCCSNRSNHIYRIPTPVRRTHNSCSRCTRSNRCSNRSKHIHRIPTPVRRTHRIEVRRSFFWLKIVTKKLHTHRRLSFPVDLLPKFNRRHLIRPVIDQPPACNECVD